jgi:hypothetical protein
MTACLKGSNFSAVIKIDSAPLRAHAPPFLDRRARR